MGRIDIDSVRCKGCGRCITACPEDLIQFSHELNDRGYTYVSFTGDQAECSGCTICAVVCPDQGIEVWNHKDKQTFVNTTGLTENMTHYCPGCTHGVIHRLVAEAIEPSASGSARWASRRWAVASSPTSTSTATCTKPRTAAPWPWPPASNALGPS